METSIDDLEMFDVDMLHRITDLLNTPKELRDTEWIKEFFIALPTASLGSYAEQISYGPDGFPYFALRIPEFYEAYDQFSLVSVLDFVSNAGVGVCLYDAKGECQWVLSYGDIWTFRETGNLYIDLVSKEKKPLDLDSVLVATPSEKVLPTYVQLNLDHYTRSFLGEEPLCVSLLMSPAFDDGVALTFNIFPENYPEDVLDDCMMRFQWLLPRNYIVMILAEGSSLRDSLSPLNIGGNNV